MTSSYRFSSVPCPFFYWLSGVTSKDARRVSHACNAIILALYSYSACLPSLLAYHCHRYLTLEHFGDVIFVSTYSIYLPTFA